MTPLAVALLAAVATAGQVVGHLSDARITEASALVDLGGVMVTANDSGNAPLLFVVDASTGQTRRTIRYADTNTDTEALAPAGDGAVWVGDIGDNLGRRAEVQVHRVPLDGGPVATYRLRYADRPHDAESLFALHGRLYVVSKELFGGAFYAAPARLDPDGVNVLRRVAPAPSIATDAAAYPDQRHVLVRDYGSATLYEAPSFRRLGSFALPEQQQGEGISVGPGGRIRLTSEGADSAVLQVSLPPELARTLAASRPAAPSRPAATPGDAGSTGAGGGRGWTPWIAGAGAVAVLAGGAAVLRRRTLR